MGTRLVWIWDCWSLFVTNLAPATTTKNLFNVFKEAGPFFDVFLPKDGVQDEEEDLVLSVSTQNGMQTGLSKD